VFSLSLGGRAPTEILRKSQFDYLYENGYVRVVWSLFITVLVVEFSLYNDLRGNNVHRLSIGIGKLEHVEVKEDSCCQELDKWSGDGVDVIFWRFETIFYGKNNVWKKILKQFFKYTVCFKLKVG